MAVARVGGSMVDRLGVGIMEPLTNRIREQLQDSPSSSSSSSSGEFAVDLESESHSSSDQESPSRLATRRKRTRKTRDRGGKRSRLDPSPSTSSSSFPRTDDDRQLLFDGIPQFNPSTLQLLDEIGEYCHEVSIIEREFRLSMQIVQTTLFGHCLHRDAGPLPTRFQAENHRRLRKLFQSALAIVKQSTERLSHVRHFFPCVFANIDDRVSQVEKMFGHSKLLEQLLIRCWNNILPQGNHYIQLSSSSENPA